MSRGEKILTTVILGVLVWDKTELDAARVHALEWRVCARVAEWFGRRALVAEARYREEIAP